MTKGEMWIDIYVGISCIANTWGCISLRERWSANVSTVSKKNKGRWKPLSFTEILDPLLVP